MMRNLNENFEIISSVNLMEGTFDFLKMVVYLQYSLFWFYCFLQ